jgi:ABC-type amino acid transport substrate-binding protein
MVAKSNRLSSHEVTLTPSQRIEGFGIGVALGNDTLREQVMQAILQLQKNKVIAQYATQWFEQGSK